MRTPEKTETVVQKNTETVESQISETQEQVLDNVQETTSELLDPTLVDAGVDTFTELKSQFDNGEIDDSDLLFALMQDKSISEDQFVEIRGVPSAEVFALVNAPKQETPVEPLYSFVDAFEKVQASIKAGTSPEAILADVASWRNRNEISEDTKNRLVEKLAEASNKISTTAANLNQMQILDAITAEGFASDLSLSDLQSEGTSVINSMIKHAVEFEGSMSTQLIHALAGIAVHGLKIGKQTSGKEGFLITVRGDPDINKNKPYTATTHQALWNYVKKEKMFGTPITDMSTHGDFARIHGKTFDPYTDKSVASLAPMYCIKSLLVANGAKTGVRFGYWSRKSSMRDGKALRPSRLTVFNEEIPENADPKQYFRNVCVPANILIPRVNMKWEEKVVGVVDTGETKRELKAVVLDPNTGDANTDTTLRYLNDDVALALYQHHFAGHKLTYNMTEKGDKLIPIGCINGSHDPRFTPNSQQRESASETLAKTKAELAKVAQDNAALVKGIQKENRVATVQTLEAYVSNKHMPLDENEPYHYLRLALTAFKRAINNGRDPDDAFLKVALELKREIETVIDDDPAKSPVYKSPIGGREHAIAA